MYSKRYHSNFSRDGDEFLSSAISYSLNRHSEGSEESHF
jgi:hypothetical protein